jgi:hypothetical protein
MIKEEHKKSIKISSRNREFILFIIFVMKEKRSPKRERSNGLKTAE